MSPDNPIIGTVTVSAPFEREDRTYYATVVFDLHEDGQRSLRKQDVNDGLHIVYDQDFQEEAYALMHAHDTRELQIEVEQLKRENEKLRERLAVERSQHEASIAPLVQAASDAMSMRPVVIHVDRAALSPQEAARG